MKLRQMALAATAFFMTLTLQSCGPTSPTVIDSSSNSLGYDANGNPIAGGRGVVGGTGVTGTTGSQTLVATALAGTWVTNCEIITDINGASRQQQAVTFSNVQGASSTGISQANLTVTLVSTTLNDVTCIGGTNIQSFGTAQLSPQASSAGSTGATANIDINLSTSSGQTAALYDIIDLEGTQLYFGDNSGSKSSPQTRPQSFNKNRAFTHIF